MASSRLANSRSISAASRIASADRPVAGAAFGLALISLGFSAVLADSIARLFFRNSVAIGAHCFPVPGITSFVEEGDELEIDMESWLLRNHSRGTEMKLEPYSDLIREIIDAGGIIEVLKRRIHQQPALQGATR